MVTEGKKWYLKLSQKEQNLTPDIFSCKCRIEIKLSTYNYLNINQNFWKLYFRLHSFAFFMATFGQNGHGKNWVWSLYSSMIASEVVLRTSSKKSKTKLIPQGYKVKVFKCDIPLYCFRHHIWHIMAILSMTLYRKHAPYPGSIKDICDFKIKIEHKN